MELEIYEAFVSAGIESQKAKAAAESVNAAIDKRYAIHSAVLATRGDVNDLRGAIGADIANAKTELVKAIAESQRWTLTAIFAGLTALAIVQKML